MPATDTNKIKYGLKNLYIAVMLSTVDATSGLPTYSTPVHVCGAATMGLSAKVNRNAVPADDETEYEVVSEIEGYEGDIELVYIPDTIYADIMGHTVDADGGIIVNKDDQPKTFALMCEWSGDKAKKRTVYYNCIAQEPKSDEAETGNKPKNEKLKIKARPLSKNGNIKYSLKSTDTAAATAYAAFFDDVQFPPTAE